MKPLLKKIKRLPKRKYFKNKRLDANLKTSFCQKKITTTQNITTPKYKSFIPQSKIRKKVEFQKPL